MKWFTSYIHIYQNNIIVAHAVIFEDNRYVLNLRLAEGIDHSTIIWHCFKYLQIIYN